MLEAIALRCERGERLLFDGLEFTLSAGTLLRVAGANGSGKTSLLRILCGLAQPASGEVRWNGEPIRRLREEYHRQLIYIGHLPAVKDELTCHENVAVACALAGAPRDDDSVKLALDRVGLDRYRQVAARSLSQGQRRRVALARLAACSTAALWILDEPYTALDTAAVDLVQQMIAEHLERGGVTVITSHREVMPTWVSIRVVELGG